MKPYRHPVVKALPLAALLFLAACPQMTTGAISGGGAPLSATGDKSPSAASDTFDKDADTFAPPPAAAPLPPPGGDPGGLGGAGSGSPEYAARIMGPMDGAPAGDAAPISGPITVARESGGGVLSSPSPSEHIETFKANVRLLGWPAGVRREWSDAADLFRKIEVCRTSPANCELTEEVAKKVVVLNGPFMLEGTRTEAGHYAIGVISESEIPDQFHVRQSGHYLYFVTKDHQTTVMGGGFETVASLEDLMALATDDRLKLVAEKDQTVFLFPITLDPSLYYPLMH